MDDTWYDKYDKVAPDSFLEYHFFKTAIDDLLIVWEKAQQEAKKKASEDVLHVFTTLLEGRNQDSNALGQDPAKLLVEVQHVIKDQDQRETQESIDNLLPEAAKLMSLCEFSNARDHQELLPLLFMAFQVVTQLFNNLPQGLETGSANVMGKAISLPMSVIKTFHVAYEKALEENAVSNVKQVMDHVSNTECPNKLPRKISEMVPQEFADFMQSIVDQIQKQQAEV